MHIDTIKIGTRGSKLALAQAKTVAHLLKKMDISSVIVEISTAGDEHTSVPLHEIGGQGVFVKALDDAIIDGRIDIAVHSMKDIPAERPDELVTVAILKRDSPADFMVTNMEPEDIRTVGTSSTRRTAQIRRNFPGVTVKPLRGNIDTRLRKLNDGEFDAIVLAKAGLERLGLDLKGFVLDPHRYIPSTNQGTIAVVGRDDKDLINLISPLDDKKTRIATSYERIVMEIIGGGCFTPFGCFCDGEEMFLEVLSLEGDRHVFSTQKIGSEKDLIEIANSFKIDSLSLISEAAERLKL